MLKNKSFFSTDATRKSTFQYYFIEKKAIKEKKNLFLSFFVDKNRRNYIYDYTYNYDWVDLKENTLLRCKSDNNISFHLGTKKLSITKNNKTEYFYLKDIRNVSLELKKMILPILLGGTIAPLTFLDILKTGNNTWWAISVAFGALLSLYYGLRGRYQLKISLDYAEHHFFIKNKNVCWEDLMKKLKEQIVLKKM